MGTHLQKDIEKLKNKIITMGGEIEDRVYKATLSIINRDAEMAKAVINSDYDIDQMEVEIEDSSLKTLALYQPVARDLRYIIAILKINNDLERVGDLAVNIAERSLFLAGHPEYELFFDIEAMADKVEKMLTGSIDSLVQVNAQLAHKIRAEDDVVDEYTRQMYQRATEILAQTPDHINFVLQAVSAGRHLERIADHATNIAEDVIYLVDAEIVRHTPEVYAED
ncbi:MAG: phosphate signaling complex protein PhoU [Desulfurivibrionaceae bacterium]